MVSCSKGSQQYPGLHRVGDISPVISIDEIHLECCPVLVSLVQEKQGGLSLEKNYKV